MTEHVPWLYTAARLKKEGRFAILLGMICGVLPLVSFGGASVSGVAISVDDANTAAPKSPCRKFRLVRFTGARTDYPFIYRRYSPLRTPSAPAPTHGHRASRQGLPVGHPPDGQRPR